mmetsp:Transcript_4631/g.10223  ORF Transcript_4631/g.10223 Transcript_4631/m.10223 type:complete len:218 (-) Transcript_4631:66-719(-)
MNSVPPMFWISARQGSRVNGIAHHLTRSPRQVTMLIRARLRPRSLRQRHSASVLSSRGGHGNRGEGSTFCCDGTKTTLPSPLLLSGLVAVAVVIPGAVVVVVATDAAAVVDVVVVVAAACSLLDAGALLSRVLTSKALWQQFPQWSKFTHIPLALKFWALKILLQFAAEKYLQVERNVLLSYLADVETRLIEENLPVEGEMGEEGEEGEDVEDVEDE